MVVISPATWPGRILFLHLRCFFLLLCSFNFNVPEAAAAASTPTSFSMDFGNTSSYRLQDLRFEGDASMNYNDNLVDLTCNSKEAAQNIFCRGRMSYNHPVPFYDNSTGEVASFFTRFTFSINLNGSVQKGDGMAFFLSGYPSALPKNSAGSLIGLADSSNQTVETVLASSRFVAVEFDTYNNPWDPTGSSDHIGIDLSSVTSVSATRLTSYSLNGTMTATVTFDGSTRMLAASVNFDDNPSLGTAQVKTQLPEPLHVLLPPKVAVGFSAGTGGYFELHQILSWSFNSTMSKTDSSVEPKGANNIQPKQGQTLGTKGHNINARVIIAGAILSVPLVWFVVSWFMWKRAGISFVKRAGLDEFRRFDYHYLFEATGGFSMNNTLGEGHFGIVYKGTFKKKHGGLQEEVAVKRIKESSLKEANTFLGELTATSQTSHKNVVKLKGWCCRRIRWKLSDFMFCRQQHNTDLFLVYELVPNGSLQDHLYQDSDKPVLSWETRYEIAKGIGSGLCYLHHQCKPIVLHRDIKPANILLEADFSPKLADFGLSRIAKHNYTIPSTTAIGTNGYIDPLLCKNNAKVKFGRSSDVYSFGIVLLDVATGKTTDLVREMYRSSRTNLENFLEVAPDINLGGAFNRTQMKQMLVLSLWCCFPDATQRPSMLEAMKVLDNDTLLLQKGMDTLANDTPLLKKIMGTVEKDDTPLLKKAMGTVEDYLT